MLLGNHNLRGDNGGNGIRYVDGYIMKHKTKDTITVKCTKAFKNQWEKRGFKVVYEGKIDVSDWDLK